MSLPTWITKRPSTSSGEAAVPQNNFDVSIAFEKSRVQSGFPVAVSHALRTPVTPSVNRRLPMTSGVELGPFAISTAYWFFLKAAWYFCSQMTLPSARLMPPVEEKVEVPVEKLMPFETP